MAYGKTVINQEIVPLLKAGDESAFAALYDAYASLLFGVILRIVHDRKEAENLLQDCFVKIWRNIESYDPEKGRLATWLVNIARNTAIDYTRSKYFSQRRKNQNLENIVLSTTGSATSHLSVDTLGLRQLVEKMKPAYRQVIEWMYFDGYTQKEISDNFQIPLGTVKTRTRMALRALRNLYL